MNWFEEEFVDNRDEIRLEEAADWILDLDRKEEEDCQRFND